MIVLDEQLLGRGIEHDIARWYRGKVQFIIELRPNTVIKDDAIPTLLRQQPQPTFVTINAHDFWQRVPGDSRYCVVCFTLSDDQIREIPQSLRALFRHPEFHTKAQRMGKVIRVTSEGISFYTSQTFTASGSVPHASTTSVKSSGKSALCCCTHVAHIGCNDLPFRCSESVGFCFGVGTHGESFPEIALADAPTWSSSVANVFLYE